MSFWACRLVSSPGLKLSFSNCLALSTKFCAVFFFCCNSMSHRCLILFINILPFCLSSLFTCTNFSFSFFVHSPLFKVWKFLLCNWLAVLSALTYSATASLATSCTCWDCWVTHWYTFDITHWYLVHPGLPSTLDKAVILAVLQLLPDSAIGNLIKERPSTHIGTVPSGSRL